MCKSRSTHGDCPTDFERIKGWRKVIYAVEYQRIGAVDVITVKCLCTVAWSFG